MAAAIPIKVLAYGSCHLHDPVQLLLGRGQFDVIMNRHSNYTSEAIQMVRYYMGLIELPIPIRNRAMHWPDYPKPDPCFAAPTDVAFLEICNPYEIRFREYFLNRTQMVETIVANAIARGGPAADLAHNWFYNGILKQDEEVRARAAVELLKHLPDESEQDHVDREIVAETYGYRQTKDDLRRGITAFVDLLDRPAIILSHTLNYMPDGRPVNWPPGLYSMTNELCAELGLQIFNPREFIVKLIAERGREYVLHDDLHHHTATFHALVADHLLAMAQDLVRGASADRGADCSSPSQTAPVA